MKPKAVDSGATSHAGSFLALGQENIRALRI